MASYTQAITLDVSGMCLPFYKYIKQGDGDSTWIVVTMVANGTQLIPASTDTATIRVTKPDGTIVNNPATINADGTITARITKAMTAAAGLAKADICLIGESYEVLSTASFFLDIDAAPGTEGIASTNEFLYLLELLDGVEDTINAAVASATAAAEASAAAADQSADDAETAKEAAEQAKDDAQAAVRIVAFRVNNGYIQYTNDGTTWNNLLPQSSLLGKPYNPVDKDITMTLPVGVDSQGKLWAAGNTGSEKFGVSGVGGSSTTLTRLWDAAGLTATPGTDQEAGSSDFDKFPVFNRKKCVGSWSVVDGKAVFTPQAYYGDADYSEDGTMGDYVAVDVLPTYWYEDKENGILGVSGSVASGWDPHPVCVDKDGNVREHTYLPVYALGQKDGHAVSLPGYYNYFGSYKNNWDAARTYGDESTFANFAIIEPSAVDHYEWLLMTIEFATQDMQTVMQGATGMAYNASHIITGAPAANKLVLTAAIGNTFVVGQTFQVGEAHNTGPSSIADYNTIESIENCDEDGTLNASGAYRLITYDGTDRTASITPGTTKLGSRPWITGAAQGAAHGVAAVLGHTGSPVSNTDAKHPMMYRWRENVYGNQNMTCLDLMDVRVEDGTDEYKLQWYHNPELQTKGAAKWSPSSSGSPSLAELQNAENGWELLGVETPKESYVNGYIKEESADERWPHVRVPTLTRGASATTYTGDYALLVNSPVVRAVRRRGTVLDGRNSGPRFVLALHAPSNAHWNYGSGLYFVQ